MKLVEAATAAPPVSVVGLTLWGFPLQEWVYVATLIYTLFLLIDKFPVVYQRLLEGWRWLKERNVQSK